ncbi:hypothetical protein HG534_00700 [Moraxella osloensis]|nr:hypothetical protein [Moraxella osloensis]EBN0206315.1 hypothetical protein [Salmonella enterica subsp. enterica serovar Enteritidis]MBW4014827.1 hypothetical protein [Moraxella osloensis]QQU06189.1 hypothetical protein I6I87_08875 [Moraxella osloensis]
MQTLQLVATAQDEVIVELQALIKAFLQNKPDAIIKKMETESGVDNDKRQAGILAGYTADPAFYEPLDEAELARW